MRKLVIIRGKVTAGKTITSYELAKVLPNWIFIDIWKIKEIFEPLNLKDRKDLIYISKKATRTILRETIRKMKRNIIVQEMTLKYLKKHFGDDLKKYDYRIYSFFLDIDLNSAIKRDIQREKPTLKINQKFKNEEAWKKRYGIPEKGDIIIDTSKYSTKEIVNVILKEIGEKRKKHPRAYLIRKSW